MFRGFNKISIDSKGRITMPRCYREHLSAKNSASLVLTLSPTDRTIFLYPVAEWERIESQLATLTDFEKQIRRAKQMMRGYATDCHMDSSGRILIPRELRDYAQIEKQVAISGQGNKFEIWNASAWAKQHEIWIKQVDDNELPTSSSALQSLAL